VNAAQRSRPKPITEREGAIQLHARVERHTTFDRADVTALESMRSAGET
jgi:hypothetical protein